MSKVCLVFFRRLQFCLLNRCYRKTVTLPPPPNVRRRSGWSCSGSRRSSKCRSKSCCSSRCHAHGTDNLYRFCFCYNSQAAIDAMQAKLDKKSRDADNSALPLPLPLPLPLL